MHARRSTRTVAALLVGSFALSCAKDDTGSSTKDAGTGDECTVVVAPEEEIPAPPIHTPRWAFEPWISKDISDGADTYAFVQGFKDRDIPVGVVVIDSPWETHYNTFVPNEARYPQFAKMVADMHGQDVRVVLWMTQMVNNWYLDGEVGGDFMPGAAPNFEPGQACGFFVNEGRIFTWWKGSGAALDFFHPSARAWWHEQQNALLDMGVNGWKLDFAESYVRADPVQTYEGDKSHQAYSEAYYRDFYAYGAHRKGGTEEFVTMVRPWDESYDFDGRFHARPEHAPVAWVGDQRRDWYGLSDALDHIFRSAAAGYAVVGSDIGGYLDFDDKDVFGDRIAFDLEVFERWVALGAMTPFMQLHGRANVTPWDVPDCEGACADEVVALYRYWSKLHHEMVPFFYSLAQEAHASGRSMLFPQGEASSWPGDYRFLLGEAFLVAPILDATGVRDVELPAGPAFYDFWKPQDDAVPGGTTVASYVAAKGRIPLFIKQGAIVPLQVSDDVTGFGTAASEGALTVLVYPSSAPSTFRLHDEDDEVTTLGVRKVGTTIEVSLSRAVATTILRVRTDVAPVEVRVGALPVPLHESRDAFDVASSGWWADPENRCAWVKLGASASSLEVVLTP